jgi:hypothetical protein
MNKRILNLSVATLTCLASNLVLNAPSHAADLLCTGVVGAVTVDNLVIPDNVTCTLNKTRINGSVELGLNSTLIARGVTVVGNVQGDEAKAVTITQAGPTTSPTSSRIGGNIELQKGGTVTVNAGTRITGDIIIEEHAGLIILNGNTVTGSVQVSKNLGGARIRSNTISGNLQCQDNLPAPTGALNTVSGNKEDQCVTF